MADTLSCGWVVMVGTDPNTAHPLHKEFAGSAIWGPYTYDEAMKLADLCEQEWMRVLAQDQYAFIYGAPYARAMVLNVGPNNSTPSRGARGRLRDAFPLPTLKEHAKRACRNWYRDSDDLINTPDGFPADDPSN